MKNRTIMAAAALLVVLFVIVTAVLPKAGLETVSLADTYMDKVFDKSKVHTVDITMNPKDLQSILDNPLDEEMMQANVTVDGKQVDGVGIRVKGNMTLSSVAQMEDSDRYSFKIDFDHYNDDENLYGLRKLNLNNNYSDPTQMREYLSYELMNKMDVPAPGYAYMYVTINGREWGLYLGVEAIEEPYLQRNFGNSTGDLYKPDGTGSDLKWISDDIKDYTGLNLKTNPNSTQTAMLKFLDTINHGGNVADVADVDEMLRYFAATTALVSLDSYQGQMKHNYYLYEQNGKFSMLPWDYNMAFAGFGVGMGGGMGGRGGMNGGQGRAGNGNAGAADAGNGANGAAPGGNAAAASGNGANGVQADAGAGPDNGVNGANGAGAGNGANGENGAVAGADAAGQAQGDAGAGQRGGVPARGGQDGANGGAAAAGNGENGAAAGNGANGAAPGNGEPAGADAAGNANPGQRGQGRQGMGGMGMDMAANFLSEDNINFSITTPVSGTTLDERPLIKALLSVDEYKEKYNTYLQQIADGFFAEANMQSLTTQVSSLIAPYVEKDPTKFYTKDQLLEGASGDKSLVKFATERAESIKKQLSGELVVEAKTDGGFGGFGGQPPAMNGQAAAGGFGGAQAGGAAQAGNGGAAQGANDGAQAAQNGGPNAAADPQGQDGQAPPAWPEGQNPGDMQPPDGQMQPPQGMQGGPGQGNMPWAGRQGGGNDRGGFPGMPGMGGNNQNAETGRFTTADIIIAAVFFVLLIGVTLFAMFFSRRRTPRPKRTEPHTNEQDIAS
ncbi:CotH kinase family protein [Paenibacillus sp. Y412MC10]|uniref:CotH kinase family protein n=1 Tax=Geobacillus sp. (strain Y412MC10) TaxID=481743 RepID=UPI0021B179C2|nr:CotH kinase family protein [Paenibacillus sp. Y412MC10]